MNLPKQTDPVIYYLAPDYASPSWGVAMLYFHVEMLCLSGRKACVLHQTPGFRIEWISTNAPVRYLKDLHPALGENDILVVPEMMALKPEVLNLPGRKIVFVQNAFLISEEDPARTVDYANLGYERAMAVMPHVKEVIENFCGIEAEVVPPFIADYCFAGHDDLPLQSREKKVLLYSKDKQRDFKMLRQFFLEAKMKRKNLNGWQLVELNGYSHAEAARLMKKSSFLVNLNTREAFNTSVPEAMAAGCIVFCYDAYGGNDFLRTGDNAFVFKNYRLHELSKNLFGLLDRFDNENESLEKVRKRAHETASGYSKGNAQEALNRFFDRLMSGKNQPAGRPGRPMPENLNSRYKKLVPAVQYLHRFPEHRAVLLLGAAQDSVEYAFLKDQGFQTVAAADADGFAGSQNFDVCIYLACGTDEKKIFELSRTFLRKYGLLFIGASEEKMQSRPELSGDTLHETLRESALLNGFAYLERIPMAPFWVYGLSGVIDIVVPAYNAFDYVRHCIRSVYINTIHIPFRLILVDDASSEPAIAEFFFSQKRPQDIYLRHDENQGFVKSSNRGFGQSELNDAVILNTDTVVTRRWLEHLFKAAMRGHAIGAVNPLSNEASIYSIKRLSPYKIPRQAMQLGFWISELDPVYPEIPTAVGFCLYFKRRLLNDAGWFDEIYGHGYGEENDLCMRAKAKGYRFVLADNAYVFHQGHVSMSRAGLLAEGAQTNPAHEAILVSRYPGYPNLIEQFMNTKIMTHIRIRTGRCIQDNLVKGRKKIMFAVHNPIDGSHIGGTELHVKDLVAAFKGSAVCYVTYFLNSNIVVHEYADEMEAVYAFELSHAPDLDGSRSDIEVSEKYKLILGLFEIDLVHVHHLKNATPDIITSAKELNLPVIMTFHDFYMVSPDHGMMFKFHMEGRRAPRPNRFYFQKHFKIKNATIESWCEAMRPFIRMIDEAVFPSCSARDEILKYYPEIRRYRVLEHGYPLPENFARSDLRAAATDTAQSSAVCFLGAVHDQRKGRREIAGIIRTLIRKKIHVHLLGSNPHSWKTFSQSDYFHVHGLYLREELPARLAAINPVAVALLPAGIETHGYTLTESWLAGYPVITWPIGAMAERIYQQGGGIVLDKICKREFIRCLQGLIDNPVKREMMRQSVAGLKLKSMDQSFAEYENFYNQYFCLSRPSGPAGNRDLFNDEMLKHQAGYTYAEMQKRRQDRADNHLWQRLKNKVSKWLLVLRQRTVN